MNEELIQKLVDQCVDKRERHGSTVEVLQSRKFAKLIVQECIDYINYRTKDWDAELRWIFNDGSGYMDVDVDSLLKEHFGVEREASKKD